MAFRKRLAGVAIAASLLGSMLGAPPALAGVAELGPYDSFCYSSGSGLSGFKNTTTRSRNFLYVWRAGTTVLGYGSVRLAPGAPSPTYTTPAGATKFGIVTNSTTYAYVTCM